MASGAGEVEIGRVDMDEIVAVGFKLVHLVAAALRENGVTLVAIVGGNCLFFRLRRRDCRRGSPLARAYLMATSPEWVTRTNSPQFGLHSRAALNRQLGCSKSENNARPHGEGSSVLWM
jgi:hypothetical protein